VITLRVPPLRERREDILPLAQWLLNVAAVRNSHPGLALSPGATAALTRYRWPGNVRELRNAIERGTVLMRGETIAPDDLPDSLFHEAHEPTEALTGIPNAASLDELEREHIARVLAASATLEEAADTLGINVTTLWRKRRRYGIE
jgi:NtrC-family two-component system response regulator AlgB